MTAKSKYFGQSKFHGGIIFQNKDLTDDMVVTSDMT